MKMFALPMIHLSNWKFQAQEIMLSSKLTTCSLSNRLPSVLFVQINGYGTFLLRLEIIKK